MDKSSRRSTNTPPMGVPYIGDNSPLFESPAQLSGEMRSHLFTQNQSESEFSGSPASAIRESSKHTFGIGEVSRELREILESSGDCTPTLQVATPSDITPADSPLSSSLMLTEDIFDSTHHEISSSFTRTALLLENGFDAQNDHVFSPLFEMESQIPTMDVDE